MSTISSSSGRTLLLDHVDWPTYSRLLRAFAERPGIKLTYDRGRLEIMSPLHEHESDADFLGRLVVVLTEELKLPIKAGGSTTYRRRRKRRGLEADNSYWILSEPKVRGKRHIDLRVDPAPDLAIEVDVTRSSLDRMSIYAALKVLEVWRLAGGLLSFHVLQDDGTYAEGPSRVFPGLRAADLLPFFALRNQFDENEVIRRFRDWVKQRIAAGWK